MPPSLGNVLNAGRGYLSGAAGFAKHIATPGQRAIKATFSPISGAPLGRSSHSISVVKGRAYIFGGELTDGQLADNDMHVVILPSSGVSEADYYTISPKAAKEDGGVPAARKGHTAVVVGDDIFIFGGDVEGGADESGRVWVFSTSGSNWTALSPANAEAPVPQSRAFHAAAASEEPAPKETKTEQTILPQQPPDPSQVVPEPPEPGTWGTVFISGGKAADGELIHDLWTFDIRSRIWNKLASPPGPARIGASLVCVGTRLYLFGGVNTTEPVPAGVSHFDVSGLWRFAESGGPPARTLSGDWETIEHEEGAGPATRSGAALVEVTAGKSGHYLLLVGGLKPDVQEGGLSYLDDIWAFQLPTTVAATPAKAPAQSTVKLDTKDAHWTEVQYQYMNEDGDIVPDRPASLAGTKGMDARIGFAATKGTEVEGASVIVWGGADESGKILDNGWMITVDR
ncbi:Kelch-type beta propeller [Lasiodiplodia theobromae]|uniref:Multiple epidermal growth factor-like domains protein 8 n=1 Tax=Lasiodiplodia theobromae TaxID=45133 RepID=A0A5N5DI09_9PEZI|nr:Kelch-type beta propeller [Lasiodiplodia theobromae]KAB2576594.1 Multiple epidermal growth factor-like domains protein 8 [Lasiodiplodia theobromae]KAF4546605.1 Kelch-type beta propeller [Lasiodiplodia theobromae]